MPFFQVPSGFDGDSYLRHICEEGARKIYKKDFNDLSDEVKERLDYELEVIKKMGWPSYFLIVG